MSLCSQISSDFEFSPVSNGGHAVLATVPSAVAMLTTRPEAGRVPGQRSNEAARERETLRRILERGAGKSFQCLARFPLWHEHVIRRQSNQKTTKVSSPSSIVNSFLCVNKKHICFARALQVWNRPTASAHLHKIHFEAKWGTVGDQMSELLSGICSRGSFSFFLPSRVCVSFRAVQRGVIPQ